MAVYDRVSNIAEGMRKFFCAGSSALGWPAFGDDAEGTTVARAVLGGDHCLQMDKRCVKLHITSMTQTWASVDVFFVWGWWCDGTRRQESRALTCQ